VAKSNKPCDDHGWLYEKLAPYRAWLDTLPLWKRILAELVSIAIVTAPFTLGIYWLTGETHIFLPVAQ